ncbi:MAG: hypothetical protein KDK27_01855 [Leptospiraceae bacterium]|nr:hypothetical protein [Leptospiraceae bacterium]
MRHIHPLRLNIAILRGICVSALLVTLSGCGVDLSKSTEENEFLKCELNLHAERTALEIPREVPYDFICEAKQSRVQLNSLKISYIAGGHGLGAEELFQGESVQLTPGNPVQGSGVVRNVTMTDGAGRRSVQLSGTITYPDDPLEKIENLEQLERDKINYPAKYNLLVSRSL